MNMRGKGAVLATVAGIVALGLLAGRCAPSAPKGAKKGAAVSDIAAAAMKVTPTTANGHTGDTGTSERATSRT